MRWHNSREASVVEEVNLLETEICCGNVFFSSRNGLLAWCKGQRLKKLVLLKGRERLCEAVGSGKWLSERRTGLRRSHLTDTALPPWGRLFRSSREPQSGQALALRRGRWWWNRGEIPWWGGSYGKISRLTGSTLGSHRSNKETSFTPLPQVLQQILIPLGRKVEVLTAAWKPHVTQACYSGDVISSIPSAAMQTSFSSVKLGTILPQGLALAVAHAWIYSGSPPSPPSGLLLKHVSISPSRDVPWLPPVPSTPHSPSLILSHPLVTFWYIT